MSERIKFLLLIGAVFLVYFNSFQGAFQFDDYNVIVNNPKAHSFRAWFDDLSYGIRPLLKFTYALNWTSGLGLFGFHLFNIAIHATNAVLVYVLALRLLRRRSDPETPAFIGAILFAIHPVQTEAITYICGRSASLMATFYLGGLAAYLHGVNEDKKRWTYLLSPLLFIMAVMTKETALTMPLALVLLDKVNDGKLDWKHILRRQAVHWTLFILMLFAAILHPNYGGLLEYSFDIRDIKVNLLTQINGVAYLISRLVLIHKMNIDPDLPVITEWTPVLALEAASLSALMVAGLFFLGRRPLAGFGLIWFFIHLMPTNSIVPRLDVANDRQMYLAVWGLFLAASTGIESLRISLQGSYDWIKAGIISILLLFGCFTVVRNHIYRSEVALWEDTVRKSPMKARVYNNLGYAYFLEGRIYEAKSAYLKALQLKPDFVLAANNLKAVSTAR